MTHTDPQVGIVMGSDSDWPKIEGRGRFEGV